MCYISYSKDGRFYLMGQTDDLGFTHQNVKQRIIFTFANVFPYMTLTTKLTFNFAWIHLITWYHFFQCVWIQYPRFNISGSLYYFHIVYQRKQYRLYGRKTHKKEQIFISTRYIVVAYIVISIFHSSGVSVLNLSLMWLSL